ncbi:MAG: sigma-70 family RNA polymerase sigma factor [Phycisphaerae bacterium]|nr:sigma-70 family RNA polymerase sigma factor [Phycisphaerae bacterium]
MADADNILVERFARQGDAEAFTEIVQRYSAMVNAVCRRVVGSPTAAEDACQDTFFRLLEKPQREGFPAVLAPSDGDVGIAEDAASGSGAATA